MEITYSKPDFFYPMQEKIINCKKRFTFTISGNKTGKTLSHIVWLNEKALLEDSGTEYCWLSPYVKTSEIAFNLLQKIIMRSSVYKKLEETNSYNNFYFNNSKLFIKYPNANIIRFFSGQNIDPIYGHEFYGAVVDEAARLKEEAYNALLTTMFATQGPIKLISNPTIKNNWFYKYYIKAKNGELEDAQAYKLTALDAIDAGIMNKEMFDWAEKNMARAIFRRDFMAEIPESDVSVFQYDKIYENILEEEIKNSLNKAKYIGIDPGFTKEQKNDFTVIIALDKLGRVCFFKRFKAEAEELISKLKSYINNKNSYIDSTGGGLPIFQLLKSSCPNLKPYTFNNISKRECIDNLAYYIHSNKLKYPDNEEILNELISYEIETTKTGKITYNNGKNADHDDIVIALGLACLLYHREAENKDLPFDYFINDL